MSLAPGTRFGSYEIVAALGAGGTGEVYRARDLRLGRDVAIKIVTDNLDPEHATRFRREAQLLASLNHPHIATIHGLDEAEGNQFLVMELMEGGTLADRIAQGPLPVDESLAIARQIADALQAAHEKGIIHRDLKPSNVAFTADGLVKVLDFGIAKLLDTDAPGHSVDSLSTAVTRSPTRSIEATQAGIVLGTAPYMSPEQAKGHAADRRTDVWAFACVLYEMLTGARAFEGEDASDVIGAVLRLEPDWSKLPPGVPPQVTSLLKRCLEKDRRKRIGDMSAALFVLDEAMAAPEPPKGGPYDRKGPRALVGAGFSRLVIALLAGAVVAGTIVWFAARPASSSRPVQRFAITTTPDAPLTISGFSHDVAVTNDGTGVLYIANNATQILRRPIDQLNATTLTTGGSIRSVFVSPDSQWVGFTDSVTTVSLKKVAITGGPPVTLATIDGNPRGTTWSSDDTIFFATTNVATGLQRVPAGGGEPAVLTRPNRSNGEGDHLWPDALPGGRTVLFTITPITGGPDASSIAALDLTTGTYKVIIKGGADAHYVPAGYLVYTAGNSLRAVVFDVNRLEVRGTPAPVLPRIVTTPQGGGDFALGNDGTLVYADAGSVTLGDRTLAWVDREGHEQPIGAMTSPFSYPRVSPNGRQIAISIAAPDNNIWIADVEQGTLRRLTFDPSLSGWPLWTPDGRRIVFASGPGGVENLYWQAADGSGVPERLTNSPDAQAPTDITRDGTRVVFHERHDRTMGSDIMLLNMTGKRETQALLATPADERNGTISPNGRWLAYESNSGRTNVSEPFQVYVRPFPKVDDGLWQVSLSGGTRPLWSRDGRELFFFDPDDALLAVRVDTAAPAWSASTPTVVLRGGPYFTGAGSLGRTYDISPDGKRLLMLKQAVNDPNTPARIVVVQNWFDELKKLVPSN